MRFILFPLATAAIIATAGAVIHLEIALAEIRKDQTRQTIISHAALPQGEFKTTLPELTKELGRAERQHVIVSPATVNDLQEKLKETDKTAAGFWPAAATFISYRSMLASPTIPQNLPDCVDAEPSISKILAATPDQFLMSTREYSNCKLTLDSQRDTERINSLIKTTAPFLTFTHCLIVYRGGPVKLILGLENVPYTLKSGSSEPHVVPFSGPTLVFQNCKFDFSLSTSPPDEGQRITAYLLENTTEKIDLPIHQQS